MSLFPLQVLLFVAPMLLMLLLPRLMKGMDPESQKVENMQFWLRSSRSNLKVLYIYSWGPNSEGIIVP